MKKRPPSVVATSLLNIFALLPVTYTLYLASVSLRTNLSQCGLLTNQALFDDIFTLTNSGFLQYLIIF